MASQMTSTVEVVFLGTGSAMGLHGRTTSSYVLRAGSKLILIDCGPAIIQQLHAVGMEPQAITDVCFTHAHADHALGYPMLMLWRLYKAPAGSRLPRVIASENVWAALDGLTRYALPGIEPQALAGSRIVLPTHLPAAVQLDGAETVTLRTWPLRHSPHAPVLGLRFEVGGTVIAITGDTEPCQNLIPLAMNADLLVHEATFSARLNPELAVAGHGHCTAQNAGRHAAAAKVRRLALVHLDVKQEGQETVYIAEAAAEYGGCVSAPVDGTIYSV